MRSWAALSALFFLPSLSLGKEYVFATLEWPPYTCESCSGQGTANIALKKVFESKGHTLRFIFYPWSRCVQEAQKGRVHACWPAWQADLVGTELVSSKVIFFSPLGVAERVDHPLKIKGFKDLSKVRLGVVQGYGYSQEYLDLVKQGVLKPEIVRADIQNIEKLGGKRIDATLIDVVNFKYLIETKAQALKDKVRLNKTILSKNSLHIGMNKETALEIQNILK